MFTPQGEIGNDVSCERMIVIFLNFLDTIGEIVVHAKLYLFTFYWNVFLSHIVSYITSSQEEYVIKKRLVLFTTQLLSQGSIVLMIIGLKCLKYSLLKYLEFSEVLIIINFSISYVLGLSWSVKSYEILDHYNYPLNIWSSTDGRKIM